MKRPFAVLMAVLMVLLMLTVTTPAALASDKIILDETWAVLMPENPSGAENSAAEILNDGLSRVFGSPLDTGTKMPAAL